MEKKIYSVRDKHVGFGAPMIEDSDAAAIRGFEFALSQDNSMFKFAPADFDLYCVGTFDSSSGLITPFPVPQLIRSGHA